MRAKAKQNNTYRQSPGLFSPHVRRNVPLWNHIHPTSSRSAVMADLLRRVGKMLAMRPMTIIPLRRGPPPFTIALVRMFQMNKTAQTWEQTVQRVHSWVHKEHKSTQSEHKIRKKLSTFRKTSYGFDLKHGEKAHYLLSKLFNFGCLYYSHEPKHHLQNLMLYFSPLVFFINIISPNLVQTLYKFCSCSMKPG